MTTYYSDDAITRYLEWNEGLRILLVGYGSRALTHHEHAEAIVKSLGKERFAHYKVILTDRYEEPQIPHDSFWDSDRVILVSSDVIMTMVEWDLVFIFDPTEDYLRIRGIFDEDYDGIARCNEFTVRVKDAYQTNQAIRPPIVIRESVARGRTGLPQDLNPKTTDAIFRMIVEHVVDFVENF